MKFGKFRYMHHPRLILAVTGQSIWEISKNASKVAKSIGKYFGYYQNFTYFPHWVQQCTYLCCNLGNFYYSPHILAHWQFKQWHFLKFHHFHHKSSIDHASYKYCVVCMVKHTISIKFGLLAVKAMAFFEISSLFIIKTYVNHASHKLCVICMVKHKYFHYSPHILAHW